MTSNRRTRAAIELVSSWEIQQEAYIPRREVRFELMLDMVALVGSPASRPLRILDLACGPGSISARALKKFPDAEVVAIDIDPFLLRLGELSQAPNPVQPTWVRGDLRERGWQDLLPHDEFDAVLSTTALHWLSGAELNHLYRDVHGLLRTGGLLLNGDHLPASRPWGRITDLTAKIRETRMEAAMAQGADDWERWWERARAVEVFRPEMEDHDRVFDGREHQGTPSLALHHELMREAGFQEIDLIWRDLNEGVLCALA